MQIKKHVAQRRGKKFFLLGTDEEGVPYWLVEPSWDCGWYWGFGYIQTMRGNRRPETAFDIDSHEHVNSCFWDNDYCEPKWDAAWRKKFTNSALDTSEVWKFLELMKSAYTLREFAEFCHHGGAWVSDNPLRELFKDEEMEKRINETLLPAIFKEIEKLLTPEGK